jgi:hypothetical protein
LDGCELGWRAEARELESALVLDSGDAGSEGERGRSECSWNEG